MRKLIDSRAGMMRTFYLINDTFTTDRAAGSVNGTNAEPGPGRRVVVDTENKLSVTGGMASFSSKASPANGDPGLWYESVSRAPGRLLVVSYTPTVTNQAADVGFDVNQTGVISSNSLIFRGDGKITERYNGTPLASLDAYSGGVAYPAAIAARAAGAYFFVKISAEWRLLWLTATGADSTLYPGWMNFNATATLDYLRVPSALWLPTTLASDGFSTWGTTDGLGHAEGVAGGLGSGGSGEVWTNDVGTWSASAGAAAASALSGGIAVATVDTSTADVIATVEVTRSVGDAGLVVRYADSSNYVDAIHNGTNAQLVKVVAGTPTTLVNAAATYSAGAELRVVCEGTKFRLYYNNAFIGSEQTISDAGLQSGTKQGLYTTDTGNSFDDLTIYARGSSGEYAALDAF